MNARSTLRFSTEMCCYRRWIAVALVISAGGAVRGDDRAHKSKPVVPVKVSVAQMAVADQARPRAEQPAVPRDRGPAPQALDVPATDHPLVPQAQAEPTHDDGAASSRSVLPLVRSFLAQKDDGTVFPPDTSGAIGPNHACSFLNSGFTVKNKFGGHVASQVSLYGFWYIANPAPNFPFGPRMLYDQYANRWIALCCNNPDNQDGSFASYLFVAVSDTSDPTLTWNQYAFEVFAPGHMGHWMNSPSLGVDEDNIIICGNMIAYNGPFNHADVYIFDKTPLMAGSPVTPGVDYSVHHNPCGMGGGSYQPCHTFGAAPAPAYPQYRNYLLSEGWYDSGPGLQRFVQVLPVSGVGASASILCSGLNDFTEVPCYNFNLDSADQPGACQNIDTGDSRLSSNAVLRNDPLNNAPHIWLAHTVGDYSAGCPGPFEQPGKEEIAWYEIGPTVSNPYVLEQAGRVALPTFAFYYPSIAVDRNECVLLGFSGSESAFFAGAYYTTRSSADPPGFTEPVWILKSGLDYYRKVDAAGRNRWGNYSTACVDPVDDETLWTIQEYADEDLPQFGACTPAASRWSTWWGAVRCGPAVSCGCPGQVAPGTVNGGQIRPFLSCFVASPLTSGLRDDENNCGCADMDGNGSVDMDDVPLFCDVLMLESGCQ